MKPKNYASLPACFLSPLPRSLATDAARELHVPREDSNPLCVDRAEVRVLKETDKVRLRSLLERHEGRSLKTVSLKNRRIFLHNFADETLEGKLPDKELRGLLVATDHTESDGARAVAVRLLHTAGGRGGLGGGLGNELPARSLATGGLACGLLCASHLPAFQSLSDFAFGSYVEGVGEGVSLSLACADERW